MSFLQGLLGVPNVEKMRAKRNVEGLIKALGYQKDPSVRHTVALELSVIGDTRAVEPLVTAFHDNDKDVRTAAAEALGRIGDARR